MKFLWIEDFDKGTKPELEQFWSEKYQLSQGYDVVLKKNLTSALAYIDDESNDFDAVIIDINLDSNDEEMGAQYEKYIEGIISKDFLEAHEDIEAVGGFLIFLKLILHRNFQKERIVFLTNNYTEENPTEEIIDDILDIMNQWEKDKTCRQVFNIQCDETKNDINDLLDELGNVKNKLENEIFDRFESETVESYIKFLEELLEKEDENKQSAVYNDNTYNQYKKVFCDAGIEPSKPFMKEDIEHNHLCHKRHTRRLLRWKKSMCTDYHIFRRAVREITAQIIKSLDDEKQKEQIYIFDLIPNVNSEDDKIYSLDEVKDTLSLIRDLLPLKEPDEIQKRKLYVQIIRTISHYWEIKSARYLERFSKNLYYENFYCVMKLLRNWMAHNRIDEKEFNEADVGFLFIIAIRTYFNLGCTLFPESDAVKIINHYELKLLGLQKKIIDFRYLISYFKIENRINGNSKMGEILKLSFTNITKKEIRSFKKAYKSKENIGYNVYTKMKNIGSPESEETCTITDLYKLVWHSIFYCRLAEYDEKAEDLTTYVVKFTFKKENSILVENEMLTQIFLHTFYRTFKDEIRVVDEKYS